MHTNWLKTCSYGTFDGHLFMIGRYTDNKVVWHINGKRYETLDEVREYYKISEECLVELVLKYGKPYKPT